MSDLSPCEMLAAFVAGDLNDAEHEAFTQHLATCPKCQQDLPEMVVLHDALLMSSAQPAAPAAPAAAAPAKVIALPMPVSRPPSRRMPAMAVAASVALVGVGGSIAYLQLRNREHDRLLAELIDPAERSFEPRLTHDSARAHRRYNTMLSGAPSPSREMPSIEKLSRLQELGDDHGVATVWISSGDLPRALQSLERAGLSLDTEADRAAILLAQRETARSFEMSSAILDKAPAHAAARWNAALALRDLGLLSIAEVELGKIAAGGEPGWSEEAAALAAALKLRIEERARDREALRAAADALQKTGELELEHGHPHTAAAYAREVEVLRAAIGAAP